MGVARQHVARELLERRHVVHHPERPAMRREHDVAFLEDEIVHWDDRKVELQLLPRTAFVEREPDATFGTGNEKTALLRIFTHDAGELGWSDTIVDARPRLAVIGGLPEIRLVVVELKSIRGDVRDARTEM